MKKNAAFWALLWAVLFISCEEETLEPRTNPRFSVTIIQEISSSGVEFGADIYDFGGEEILEYGFVYTQSTGVPNLNQDDFVSAQGRPEEHFELVANHSLSVGKKYYVSAFLRTPTSLVFSKSVEFISQGSEGFIINSIEWPEVIYKDQSLVVKGQRFSKRLSNYKIKIGQFDLYPNFVDSTTLVLPLPAGLLTQTTGQDIEMELRIEISEKVYTERKVLKFQEPVFEPQEIRKINLDDEITIRGNYLDLGQISIKIGNQTIQGLTAQKNELKFFLFKDSGLRPIVSSPDIILVIRGIDYNLGKLFQLNGPKVPVEKIVLSSNSQIIPIENFNREDIYSNEFFDEKGKRIRFHLLYATEKGIMVEVFGTPFPSRNFKMQINSFGVLSNLIEVEVALPVVQIEVDDRSFYYQENDLALISGGNVFVLSDVGIILDKPEENFQQQKIAEFPFDMSLRYVGVRQAVEGGFLLGGGNFDGRNFHDLYYFSLEKLTWEQLPDMPESISIFRRASSKDDVVIFEDASRAYEGFPNERWSLNLQTKQWQKLSDSNLNFWNFQVFYENGTTFMHALEYSASNNAIYKMNSDYTWGKYMETPRLNQSSIFSTPLVKDGKYYVFTNSIYDITEIDLRTKAIKDYPYPYYFNGRIPVPYSKGIYLLPNQRIFEDIRFDLF